MVSVWDPEDIGDELGVIDGRQWWAEPRTISYAGLSIARRP